MISNNKLSFNLNDDKVPIQTINFGGTDSFVIGNNSNHEMYLDKQRYDTSIMNLEKNMNAVRENIYSLNKKYDSNQHNQDILLSFNTLEETVQKMTLDYKDLNEKVDIVSNNKNEKSIEKLESQVEILTSKLNEQIQINDKLQVDIGNNIYKIEDDIDYLKRNYFVEKRLEMIDGEEKKSPDSNVIPDPILNKINDLLSSINKKIVKPNSVEITNLESSHIELDLLAKNNEVRIDAIESKIEGTVTQQLNNLTKDTVEKTVNKQLKEQIDKTIESSFEEMFEKYYRFKQAEEENAKEKAAAERIIKEAEIKQAEKIMKETIKKQEEINNSEKEREDEQKVIEANKRETERIERETLEANKREIERIERERIEAELEKEKERQEAERILKELKRREEEMLKAEREKIKREEEEKLLKEKEIKWDLVEKSLNEDVKVYPNSGFTMYVYLDVGTNLKQGKNILGIFIGGELRGKTDEFNNDEGKTLSILNVNLDNDNEKIEKIVLLSEYKLHECVNKNDVNNLKIGENNLDSYPDLPILSFNKVN